MTVIVTSADDETIALPPRLMTVLNLQPGAQVNAVVEGHTLHLTQIDAFLGLRGALADDDDFDRAMETLDQAWQTWAPPTSV